MISSYTATLARQSLAMSRFMAVSRAPDFSNFGLRNRIHANPIQITRFRGCFSCQDGSFSVNSHNSGVFKDLGRLGMGFGQLGVDRIRFSTVSDSGSGGTGGYGGGGGGGGGGGQEGGKNWSFIAW